MKLLIGKFYKRCRPQAPTAPTSYDGPAPVRADRRPRPSRKIITNPKGQLPREVPRKRAESNRVCSTNHFVLITLISFLLFTAPVERNNVF